MASSPADLLFRQPPASDAHLLFGASDTTPPEPSTVTCTLSVALPALSAAGTVAVVSGIRLHAVLPGLTCVGEVRYDSRTARPTVAESVHPWQLTRQASDPAMSCGWQHAGGRPVGWAGLWQRAATAAQGIEHRLPAVFVRAPMAVSVVAQTATPCAASAATRYQLGTATRRAAAARFAGASAVHEETDFRHQDADRRPRAWGETGWQSAQAMPRHQQARFQPATPLRIGWRGRWQTAMPPPPGRRTGPPEPPPPPRCYTPDGHLRFAVHGPVSPELVFFCVDPSTRPTVVVPVRRVYIVSNQVTLVRVSDGVPVPVLGLSLSLDVMSWTWGCSATLPSVALALVEPGEDGPVALHATVNGSTFYVLAEHVRRERQFGRGDIRIEGRGRQALLAAPYAAEQSFGNVELRTSQQLMDDVLTLNGVPLGWSIDWDLEAWDVPAGAFRHRGTYITALLAIAQAAGGYLLPARAAEAIAVRHHYPTAPWAWSDVTPDIILPDAAVHREAIKWVEQPAYNRVFVRGEGVGVVGQVTRLGSAGELLAPMVVDPLITAVSAARQRGLAVLGGGGRRLELTLKVPVLPEIGIVDPGAFVQYQDGTITRRGLVRAVTVDAGLPDVWQTLEVESRA